MVRTAALCALVATMVFSSTTAPEPRAAAEICAPAVVSLGNYAGHEGSVGGLRTFTVLVNATAAPGCPAAGSVTLSTANLTATAPSDYLATSTTLTWTGSPGFRVASIPVVTDTAAEPDERLTLRLTAPSGVSIGQGTATVTILDDDDPPVRTGVDGGKICWAIDSGAPATCPVDIRTSEPARAPITIHFRTIDPDGKAEGYVPVRDGLITIPLGATTGIAEIELRPATAPAEEKVVVELFSPSAGVLANPRAEVLIRGR